MNLEIVVLRIVHRGHPALTSKLVRQAVAYGLDRTAIARAMTGEGGLRADSAVLARTSRYYRPTWARYQRDPARARRLLERAGCSRGPNGVYVCGRDRNRLSLRFVTTANNPARVLALGLIQAQLRDVGIEVLPGYVPTIDSLTQVVEGGDFDAAIYRVGSDTGRILGPYCRGGDRNWTGYCNRLTNRDFLDADVSVDRLQWARVLRRADAKLARDVPVIPLTSVPVMFAYRSSIRGIVPNPNAPFWNVEDWWLDR